MSGRTDDIIWAMLQGELAIPEIAELERYLDGETEFYDMGYGDLSIEPYDARGGASRLFRLRHPVLGELTIGRSALKSVLHDLRHSLMKK